MFQNIKKDGANALYVSYGIAIIFTLIFNFFFIFKAYRYLSEAGLHVSTVGLFLFIPCFLFFVFVSLFSIISIRKLEKLVWIPLILLSSLLSYGYVFYGLAFDDSSPIIGIIEQTNFTEIAPYFTVSLLIWFLLFGVFPSYLIYKIKLIRFSFWKEHALKLIGVFAYPIFYLMMLLPFYSTYYPLFRLSGIAARPPNQVVPTNFFENVYHHYLDKFSKRGPYKQIALDATREYSADKQLKHDLVVIVIGETARSMSFSLNGYERPTNQYIAKQKRLISFQNVTSCDTATRMSVPCIFSNLTKKTFTSAIANNQDNLLDILSRVHFKVLWIDNNGPGDCQGVCKHVESVIEHGRDEVLVQTLGQHLNDQHGNDLVIVLHLEGSHGPAYYTKYPDAFRQFIPDCRKNEFRFCSEQLLTNAYDNSILYTDFVLNQIIELLKKQHSFWNSAMIYTSDHGESTGRLGLYGHCAPNRIAPDEQTHVPLIVWSSASFMKEKKLSLACLQKKSRQDHYSHDNLFHSILGLLDIKTGAYQAQLDLFKTCRV